MKKTDEMTSTITISMLDRTIAARLPGFMDWPPPCVELVVSVAFVSNVTDWLPEMSTELTTKVEAAASALVLDLGESERIVLPEVDAVACLVMVEKPAVDVLVNVRDVELKSVLVAAPAKMRPGVSGCVSRALRSSSRNLICNAGPTVTITEPAVEVAVARVNPQTPPRKSVVSVVHVWPL